MRISVAGNEPQWCELEPEHICATAFSGPTCFVKSKKFGPFDPPMFTLGKKTLRAPAVIAFKNAYGPCSCGNNCPTAC